MGNEMKRGLVDIVSEGTDEKIDMAFALTAKTGHDRLRLLPIAEATPPIYPDPNHDSCGYEQMDQRRDGSFF